jgi:hypothetical protein
MSAVLPTLQGWLAAAERLAGHLPDLAALLRSGSWPAMLLAAALALALLVAGSRLGRVLSGAAAALIGFAVGGLLAPAAPAWVPPALPAYVAGAVIGFCAFMAPIVYPIVLGLLPGALLGMGVGVAGRTWLGAVAGGAVLALLALWLRRLVLAATASVAGAALLAATAVALSDRVRWLATVTGRPILLLGAAALLAVAGTAFQLGTGMAGDARRGRAPAGPGRALDA